MIGLCFHCISSQQSTRRHGVHATASAIRMEAEELEELNPLIKGKRLQVVDEVFAALGLVSPPACSSEIFVY